MSVSTERRLLNWHMSGSSLTLAAREAATKVNGGMTYLDLIYPNLHPQSIPPFGNFPFAIDHPLFTESLAKLRTTYREVYDPIDQVVEDYIRTLTSSCQRDLGIQQLDATRKLTQVAGDLPLWLEYQQVRGRDTLHIVSLRHLPLERPRGVGD